MRWSDIDRALALAHDRVEINTGKYGEWLPDATSDAANPNNYDDPLRAYIHGPKTNWFEKAILDAEEAHKKANPSFNTNGKFWTVDDQPPTPDESLRDQPE